MKQSIDNLATSESSLPMLGLDKFKFDPECYKFLSEEKSIVQRSKLLEQISEIILSDNTINCTILYGETGVGKTCLIYELIKTTFTKQGIAETLDFFWFDNSPQSWAMLRKIKNTNNNLQLQNYMFIINDIDGKDLKNLTELTKTIPKCHFVITCTPSNDANTVITSLNSRYYQWKKIENFSEEEIMSFALSNFPQDEITRLKTFIEDTTGKNNSLDEKLVKKIRAISLKNNDWIKVEFEQGEVERLKQFLVEKQEKNLSAKLLKISPRNYPLLYALLLNGEFLLQKEKAPLKEQTLEPRYHIKQILENWLKEENNKPSQLFSYLAYLGADWLPEVTVDILCKKITNTAAEDQDAKKQLDKLHNLNLMSKKQVQAKHYYKIHSLIREITQEIISHEKEETILNNLVKIMNDIFNYTTGEYNVSEQYSDLLSHIEALANLKSGRDLIDHLRFKLGCYYLIDYRDYTKAVNYLDKITNTSIFYPLALCYRCYADMILEKIEDAQKKINLVEKIGNKTPETELFNTLNKGYIHYKYAQYLEAYKLYQDARTTLEEYPTHKFLFYRAMLEHDMGMIYHRYGLYVHARAYFEASLNIKIKFANLPHTHIECAKTYRRIARTFQAQAELPNNQLVLSKENIIEQCYTYLEKVRESQELTYGFNEQYYDVALYYHDKGNYLKLKASLRGNSKLSSEQFSKEESSYEDAYQKAIDIKDALIKGGALPKKNYILDATKRNLKIVENYCYDKPCLENKIHADAIIFHKKFPNEISIGQKTFTNKEYCKILQESYPFSRADLEKKFFSKENQKRLNRDQIKKIISKKNSYGCILIQDKPHLYIDILNTPNKNKVLWVENLSDINDIYDQKITLIIVRQIITDPFEVYLKTNSLSDKNDKKYIFFVTFSNWFLNVPSTLFISEGSIPLAKDVRTIISIITSNYSSDKLSETLFYSLKYLLKKDENSKEKLLDIGRSDKSQTKLDESQIELVAHCILENFFHIKSSSFDKEVGYPFINYLNKQTYQLNEDKVTLFRYLLRNTLDYFVSDLSETYFKCIKSNEIPPYNECQEKLRGVIDFCTTALTTMEQERKFIQWLVPITKGAINRLVEIGISWCSSFNELPSQNSFAPSLHSSLQNYYNVAGHLFLANGKTKDAIEYFCKSINFIPAANYYAKLCIYLNIAIAYQQQAQYMKAYSIFQLCWSLWQRIEEPIFINIINESQKEYINYYLCAENISQKLEELEEKNKQGELEAEANTLLVVRKKMSVQASHDPSRLFNLIGNLFYDIVLFPYTKEHANDYIQAASFFYTLAETLNKMFREEELSRFSSFDAHLVAILANQANLLSYQAEMEKDYSKHKNILEKLEVTNVKFDSQDNLRLFKLSNQLSKINQKIRKISGKKNQTEDYKAKLKDYSNAYRWIVYGYFNFYFHCHESQIDEKLVNLDLAICLLNMSYTPGAIHSKLFIENLIQADRARHAAVMLTQELGELHPYTSLANKRALAIATNEIEVIVRDKAQQQNYLPENAAEMIRSFINEMLPKFPEVINATPSGTNLYELLFKEASESKGKEFFIDISNAMQKGDKINWDENEKLFIDNKEDHSLLKAACYHESALLSIEKTQYKQAGNDLEKALKELDKLGNWKAHFYRVCISASKTLLYITLDLYKQANAALDEAKKHLDNAKLEKNDPNFIYFQFYEVKLKQYQADLLMYQGASNKALSIYVEIWKKLKEITTIDCTQQHISLLINITLALRNIGYPELAYGLLRFVESASLPKLKTTQQKIPFLFASVSILRALGLPLMSYFTAIELLQLIKNVYGPEHPLLARVLLHAGLALCHLREVDSAANYINKAMLIYKKYIDLHQNHLKNSFLLSKAKCDYFLGLVKNSLGKSHESIQHYKSALKIIEENYAENKVFILSIKYSIAWSYYACQLILEERINNKEELAVNINGLFSELKEALENDTLTLQRKIYVNIILLYIGLLPKVNIKIEDSIKGLMDTYDANQEREYLKDIVCHLYNPAIDWIKQKETIKSKLSSEQVTKIHELIIKLYSEIHPMSLFWSFMKKDAKDAFDGAKNQEALACMIEAMENVNCSNEIASFRKLINKENKLEIANTANTTSSENTPPSQLIFPFSLPKLDYFSEKANANKDKFNKTIKRLYSAVVSEKTKTSKVFLLYGPAGTGKLQLIQNYIANQSQDSNHQAGSTSSAASSPTQTCFEYVIFLEANGGIQLAEDSLRDQYVMLGQELQFSIKAHEIITVGQVLQKIETKPHPSLFVVLHVKNYERIARFLPAKNAVILLLSHEDISVTLNQEVAKLSFDCDENENPNPMKKYILQKRKTLDKKSQITDNCFENLFGESKEKVEIIIMVMKQLSYTNFGLIRLSTLKEILSIFKKQFFHYDFASTILKLEQYQLVQSYPKERPIYLYASSYLIEHYPLPNELDLICDISVVKLSNQALLLLIGMGEYSLFFSGQKQFAYYLFAAICEADEKNLLQMNVQLRAKLYIHFSYTCLMCARNKKAEAYLEKANKALLQLPSELVQTILHRVYYNIVKAYLNYYQEGKIDTQSLIAAEISLKKHGYLITNQFYRALLYHVWGNSLLHTASSITDLDNAKMKYEASLAIKNKYDYLGSGATLNGIGNLYLKKLQYSLAKESYESLYKKIEEKFYSQINKKFLPWSESVAFSGLALLAFYQSDYKTAENHLIKALKASEVFAYDPDTYDPKSEKPKLFIHPRYAYINYFLALLYQRSPSASDPTDPGKLLTEAEESIDNFFTINEINKEKYTHYKELISFYNQIIEAEGDNYLYQDNPQFSYVCEKYKAIYNKVFHYEYWLKYALSLAVSDPDSQMLKICLENAKNYHQKQIETWLCTKLTDIINTLQNSTLTQEVRAKLGKIKEEIATCKVKRNTPSFFALIPKFRSFKIDYQASNAEPDKEVKKPPIKFEDYRFPAKIANVASYKNRAFFADSSLTLYQKRLERMHLLLDDTEEIAVLIEQERCREQFNKILSAIRTAVTNLLNEAKNNHNSHLIKAIATKWQESETQFLAARTKLGTLVEQVSESDQTIIQDIMDQVAEVYQSSGEPTLTESKVRLLNTVFQTSLKQIAELVKHEKVMMRCFLCYASGYLTRRVTQLRNDLQHVGIRVFDLWQEKGIDTLKYIENISAEKSDYVLVIGTPTLKYAWQQEGVLSQVLSQLGQRKLSANKGIIKILYAGNDESSFPNFLNVQTSWDFHHSLSYYSLVLELLQEKLLSKLSSKSLKQIASIKETLLEEESKIVEASNLEEIKQLGQHWQAISTTVLTKKSSISKSSSTQSILTKLQPTIHIFPEKKESKEEEFVTDQLSALAEETEIDQAILASQRSIKKIMLRDTIKDCKVIPADPDGNCGFTAIRYALLSQGQTKLANQFYRQAFINCIEKICNSKAESTVYNNFILKIFEADKAKGLIDWKTKFKSSGCWLQEAHFQFISAYFHLRFHFYYLPTDANHNCFEAEPGYETLNHSEMNDAITIHLAHVKSGLATPLNHFDTLIIESTDSSKEKNNIKAESIPENDEQNLDNSENILKDISLAILKKDIERVKEQLNKVQDGKILGAKWKGHTLLHLAVFVKSFELVEIIINLARKYNNDIFTMVNSLSEYKQDEHKENKHKKNTLREAETLLYYICQYSDDTAFKITEYLLQRGALLTKRSTVHKRTAAHQAADNGAWSILKLIEFEKVMHLKKDYQRTVTDLIHVVRFKTKEDYDNYLNLLPKQIKKNEIENLFNLLVMQDEHNVEVFKKELIKTHSQKIQIHDSKDDLGRRLLHSAISQGKIKIARVMIDYYRKNKIIYTDVVDFEQEDGLWNILHEMAALTKYGHSYDDIRTLYTSFFEIVDKNEFFKALSDNDNSHGITPYYEFVFWGHTDIILDLDKKMNTYDIDIKKFFARTTDAFYPFMVSVWRKHVELLKYFIKKRGYDFEQTAAGENAFFIAVKQAVDPECQEDIIIISMLLNTDFPPLINDRTNGATALHIAAMNNNLTVVKLLLDKGADPFIKDHLNRIPLDCSHFNSAVFKALLEIMQKKDAYQAWCTEFSSITEEDPIKHYRLYRFQQLNIKGISSLKVSELDINQIQIDFCNGVGETLAHIAAAYDDRNLLDKLCRRRVDLLSRRAKDGTTPLMVAVSHNCHQAAEFLIEKYTKDQISQVDAAGEQAFYKATRLIRDRRIYGKELISLFQARITDCNFKNGVHQKTALHHAMELGNIDVIYCLLKDFSINIYTKKDYGRLPAHLASKDTLKKLAARVKTANENEISELKKADIMSLIPNTNEFKKFVETLSIKKNEFHKTVENYDLEKLRLLIKKYREIRPKDVKFSDNIYIEDHIKGDNALHYAVKIKDSVKRREAVIFLLSEGFNNAMYINHSNRHGVAPIYEACFIGDLEVVKNLVNDGCVLDFKTTDDFTLLHVSAWRGHPDIIEFLLTKDSVKSLINLRSRGDETPIYRAIQANLPTSLKMVKLLIKHKADLTIACGPREETPLHLAMRLGNIELIEFLITYTEEQVDLNTCYQRFRLSIIDYIDIFHDKENAKKLKECIENTQSNSFSVTRTGKFG